MISISAMYINKQQNHELIEDNTSEEVSLFESEEFASLMVKGGVVIKEGCSTESGKDRNLLE